MSTFDEILDRAQITPNVDVDCFPAGADLSALPSIGVHLDEGATIQLDDPTVGFSGSGQPTLFLGFAKNAPTEAAPSLTRIAGFAPVIYGAIVAFGDLLRFSETPGDEGRVVPWDVGTDGHTHISAPDAVRRVVYVTDDVGNARTGVDPANFQTSLQFDDAGTLTPSANTVTVTEISGGEYWVEFVPDNPGMLYRLRVSCLYDGVNKAIVTLNEFPSTMTASLGVPRADSLRMILGQAMVAGGAGDPGIVFLRPQVF